MKTVQWEQTTLVQAYILDTVNGLAPGPCKVMCPVGEHGVGLGTVASGLSGLTPSLAPLASRLAPLGPGRAGPAPV